MPSTLPSSLYHLHSNIYSCFVPRALSFTLQRATQASAGQGYHHAFSLSSCSGVPDIDRAVFPHSFMTM